jgi:hypothetical protein
MPRVHPNRTAGARCGVAFRGGSEPGAEHSTREEFAGALYARAEFLGELEGTCDEALATIGELIARFGDEQNPSIRSTVIHAYLLREQIIQECFRRIDDSLAA